MTSGDTGIRGRKLNGIKLRAERRKKVNNMFDIQYTNYEDMSSETQLHLKEIKGIDQFKQLQDRLYGEMDCLCWGDDRIEKVQYYQDKLTVTIVHERENLMLSDHKIKAVYYEFVFYGVELHWLDISTYQEHYIDDVTIQRNPDGKYSISFGTAELDFRYSSAEAKQCGIYRI